jgi:hypothetical protein
MLPGDDELEEVVSEVSDDEEPAEDLLDFDDEEPAGEGTFADATDGFRGKTATKVTLAAEPSTDAKALLDQVRKSKKARK